ncbi:MAG: sialidase family protein [Pirellulales bacterium]
MIVEERGLVYDAINAPADRRVAFFTSLCSLEPGTILCGFQVGSGKHSPDSTLGLCQSRDRGATWQQIPARFDTTIDGVPGSLSAPTVLEIENGRLQLFATWFDRGDPGRPLFDPVTEGILHSKLLGAVSDDRGETWSPWHVLATPGLSGCALAGPVIRWSDGTIALAFESFKEFDDPRPAEHGSWLIVSRDRGRTFGAPVLLAPRHEVYYWDARLCAAERPGEFVALYWTHDRAGHRDLDVHLRRGRIEGTAVVGRPVGPTTIRGQIAAPLVVDDRRLLAFVVDRRRPGTMKLWLSRDGGNSWPPADCLLVHAHQERAAVTQGTENVDFAEYWEDMGKWSFGHPAICRLDHQRVLLAFYSGEPDSMSIHWARVNLLGK